MIYLAIYSTACLAGAAVFYAVAHRLLAQARQTNRDSAEIQAAVAETLRAVGDTQARVEEWTS